VDKSDPTARAMRCLEVLQDNPGITTDRLADKLCVSDRPTRRYVAILREVGVPIDSVRGPYGGYRVGRGLRLPPLVFSAAEALGLVMAVLDGPWGVVVRHGRWYLLCYSHSSNARRAYRMDRVRAVEVLDDTFSPPDGLDPVAMLEEHLAVGWEYDVEVVIDAPVDPVAPRLPRAVGLLEPLDAETTRLVGSTSNPVWYAEQLAAIPASYRIVRCPRLQESACVLGQRLLATVEGPHP
jgi:predicted DNA-binding transcriptional regulator YafY